MEHSIRERMVLGVYFLGIWIVQFLILNNCHKGLVVNIEELGTYLVVNSCRGKKEADTKKVPLVL